MLKEIGVVIRKEIAHMCSNKAESYLQGLPLSKLQSFTWQNVVEDVKTNAPTLAELLSACIQKRKSNFNVNFGLCAAIICNSRQQAMNVVQKLISLVLYAGHSSKAVPKEISVIYGAYISKMCAFLLGI